MGGAGSWDMLLFVTEPESLPHMSFTVSFTFSCLIRSNPCCDYTRPRPRFQSVHLGSVLNLFALGCRDNAYLIALFRLHPVTSPSPPSSAQSFVAAYPLFLVPHLIVSSTLSSKLCTCDLVSNERTVISGVTDAVVDEYNLHLSMSESNLQVSDKGKSRTEGLFKLHLRSYRRGGRRLRWVGKRMGWFDYSDFGPFRLRVPTVCQQCGTSFCTVLLF